MNITNINPAPGLPIAKFGTLQFDATWSPAVPVAHIITLAYLNVTTETVWDGAGFLYPYASSTREAISGGYHYVIRRTGNWPGYTPALTVREVTVLGDGVTALAPNFTASTVDPDCNGTPTSIGFAFQSSIDPELTITDAAAIYDAGRAAVVGTRGKLPMLLFVHGYMGNSSSISDTVVLRAISMGFFVIKAQMRGRGVSDGDEDDSARELQDLRDCVDYCVATFPTLVDGTRVEFGYSGGAGNLIGMHSKVIDPKVLVRVCLFGFADYGESPSGDPDHSYWGTGDNPGEVITRIGPRSDLAPYRARNALRNLAHAADAGPTPLVFLWDTEDANLGPDLFRDVRKALLSGEISTSKWFAQESGDGDAIRWEHGYFEDNADLIYAEYAAYHYREVAAYEDTETKWLGRFVVAGWMAHPGFEVWTAPTGTPDPKRLTPAPGDGGSGGGQRYLVDVEFNALTGQYVVTPRADSGPCAVQIIDPDQNVLVQEVGSSPVHFDVANTKNTLRGYLLSLHAKSVFDARRVPLEGVGDPCEDTNPVELWDAVSNYGTTQLDTVGAGTPTYDAADADGYPNLTFVSAGSDQMIGTGTDNLLASTDYTIVCVFARDSGGGCPVGWHNASGATNARINLYVDATTARHQVVSNTNDTEASDTVTLGTTRHVAILERVAGAIHITIDGRARVSSVIPAGTLVADKMSVGAINQAGAQIFLFDGRLYGPVGYLSRGMTVAERAEVYARAQVEWGVT